MDLNDLLGAPWGVAQEILEKTGRNYYLSVYEYENPRFPIDFTKSRIVRFNVLEAGGIEITVMFEQRATS